MLADFSEDIPTAGMKHRERKLRSRHGDMKPGVRVATRVKLASWQQIGPQNYNMLELKALRAPYLNDEGWVPASRLFGGLIGKLIGTFDSVSSKLQAASWKMTPKV
jgi:hypothetical protein